MGFLFIVIPLWICAVMLLYCGNRLDTVWKELKKIHRDLARAELGG